ncbi:MAG: ribosome-associated translation inhibitor RaiA [Rhodobacteraceae bacterium]|nr:ribosome-associated translation inhibitor RaiA [Paracoccaceae bacterium]MCY4196220.1 ribosome-associated translation inhibitor RaiA [Paracoccaceae bacterium]
MEIQISARHIDVSDGLRRHVDQRLRILLDKFAARPTEAAATFAADGQSQRCEITVHLSTGLTVQARSTAGEAGAAFDLACDKLTKQLRRYKRRLKNHHRSRTSPVTYSDAMSSILASSDEQKDENGGEDLQPIIIAEMETRIPTLTVGEAVMQMELAETAMLLFRNQAHGRLNLVHQREDGNIGWIDPQFSD